MIALKETAEEKARKYVASIEKVLCEIELTSSSTIDEKHVRAVVETAHSYAEDAKYYLQGWPSTALAAISYAEGLLDALRFLGLVNFSWPDSSGRR